MQIIAFILAIVAVVLFLAEYTRSKSWLTLGLAVTVVAWIVQLVVTSGSHVTVH